MASQQALDAAGVSCVLRLRFVDLRPGLRHDIHLEVRNGTAEPISVTDRPTIRADLRDAAGVPVAPVGLPMSGPIQPPRWATVPPAGYAGFRVDQRTTGLPTREHGRALVALGDRTWVLGPGRYTLTASAAFEAADDGPRDQWVGELDPPPVEIVLTPQMVAVT
jgi:hypothetical protein